MAGQFQQEYRFGQANVTVVLRHPKGKFLRINPNNHNEVDENGGTGKWARWTCEHQGQHNGLKVIKLRHNTSGKYLRIMNNNRMDVGGGGGKWTLFAVHKTGSNSAKLESVHNPGKYPAVQPKGPGIGNGGKWTEFHFYRQGGGGGGGGNGGGGGGNFTGEYVFQQQRLVVLKHPKGQYLRIDPNNQNEVDEHGGTGKYAQWHIEFDGNHNGMKVIKLRNKVSGKYLRITGGNQFNAGGGGGKWTKFCVHKTGNNSAKLESVHNNGKYPAVQPNGPGVGNGGKWTEFHFYREGGNGGGQQVVYQQPPTQQPQVVIVQQQPPPQEVVIVQQQPPTQQVVYQQPPPQQVVYQQPPPQQVVYQQPPPQQPEIIYQPPPQQLEQKETDYIKPTYTPQECHEFPLPNPKPSINDNPNFNEEVAAKAAKKLRQAMKGLGTNEKNIIEVTTSYSYKQRQEILIAFKNNEKRDLIKDFKSELSGGFEKLVVGMWLAPGLYDAQQIDDAVEGLGFSTAVLNEIICTRSERQLNEIKNAWYKGMPLIKRIQKKTTKGHGNYAKLLVNLLEGGRDENGPQDLQGAKLDAEILNRFLTQEKESVAKAKFVEIMTKRSWVQIRCISNLFQEVSKKYTLRGAIEKAFGSGDTGKALCVIDEWSTQPYDFFAKLLRNAMKGMGTDDELLRRIVISRENIDLTDIGIIFGQRYGDGKTLNNWIKNELGGKTEKLVLGICGFN